MKKGLIAVILGVLVLGLASGAMAITPGPLPWVEEDYTLELGTSFSNDGIEAPFIGLRSNDPLCAWGQDFYVGAGMSLTGEYAGIEGTVKVDSFVIGLELVPKQKHQIGLIMGYEYNQIYGKFHFTGQRLEVGFTIFL